MNVTHKLLAAALAVALSGPLVAEWSLPTSPNTVPITLNDTTTAGSASASDYDDPMSSMQPAPLGVEHGGMQMPYDGSAGSMGYAGGCQDGQCAGGNCKNGSCDNGSCDSGSCGDGSCSDGSCGGESDDPCRLICETEQPWRLLGCCCCLERRRISIRGWLSGGYTANFESPPSRWNGPVTYNDRDDAQFNQAYVVLERPLDTECCGWDLGGRVDLLWGSDYRVTIARGLDAEDDFTAKWDSSRFYGLALPQAYMEVGMDELALKIGHFYTIIGYEVVPAPDNFFYSHAYTMQYGEPFTHTGLLGTWTPNKQLTVAGGATYGWDNFEDVYDDVSFLGGVTFSASDGNSKLALAVHIGDEERTFGTVEPIDQRWVYSLVYSRTLTDRLSWVIQHDNGRQDDALGSGESAEWYGVNQYLFYKINCCWSFGTRVEWFRDDDGFRVAPTSDYPALGFSTNPASAGGFEGDFWAVTMGLNYKPTTNLTIRPELRYDTYNGAPNAFGNEPYDDGGKDHQWLAAFDVIWLY
jgi:hypothetical protein